MLSRPDAELAKRDPALKGLSILLNPEAILESLHPFLPNVNIETLKPTYVKYKPSTHCLVLYELGVGSEKVYAYAVGFHPSSRNKHIKNYEKLSVAEPINLGRLILEEQSIVVNFFPNDRRLKVLSHFVDAGRRKQFLKKHFPERPELWDYSINTLNYKPEQRYVAQLYNQKGLSVILKIYEESTFQLALHNARAYKSKNQLVISKLMGRSHRHHFLLYEWVDGRQLSSLIKEPELKLETLANVGSALSILHNQKPKKISFLTRADEAKSLMATADLIGFLSPDLSGKAEDLARKISSVILDAQPTYRPIHNDFYAKQVLIEGDKVAILDLDSAVLGDPAADLGNFIAHLERDALNEILSSDTLDSLKNELVEGYNATSKNSLLPMVDLYTAAGLLRLTPEPFRYREPNWPEKTGALLDRAVKIMKKFPNQTIVQNNYNFRTIKNVNSPSINVIDPFGVNKDPLMPFLSLAINPSVFQKEFESNLHDQHLSNGKVCLRSIQVIRHKPGRRCLIEYTFEDHRNNEENNQIVLIGKADARGLRKSGYNLLKSLRKSGFGAESKDKIYVPKPVGTIPILNMWLQQKVFGEVSTHLLTKSDGTVIAKRIADAAHKIHLNGTPTKRRHTMFHELKILRERLSRLLHKNPRLEKRIERLSKACEQVGISISVSETCGIHRDYYPDQIVFDGMRLYIVDFDLYCEGDPALDIGNFLGHITEQSLRTFGNPDALLKVEKAMEDRFAELSGEETRPRVQTYKTLTLARHIYISTQFPDRRQFTERLLDLCEQRLSAVERPYRENSWH